LRGVGEKVEGRRRVLGGSKRVSGGKKEIGCRGAGRRVKEESEWRGAGERADDEGYSGRREKERRACGEKKESGRRGKAVWNRK
jgi:hypothetical protein